MLLVALFIITGISLVRCEECCNTGVRATMCKYYCCKPFPGSFHAYERCCRSISQRVINRPYILACPVNISEGGRYLTTGIRTRTTRTVIPWWGIVLIVLGVIVAINLCCVCCIKYCTRSSRRIGTVIATHDQHVPGMRTDNNNASQQQVPAPGQQASPQSTSGTAGRSETIPAQPPLNTNLSVEGASHVVV